MKRRACATIGVLAGVLLANMALAQPQGDPLRIEAKPVRTPGDPLEKVNRGLFSVHTTLDRAIFRPLALGTGKVVPKPARAGLRNFFRNLGEPIVMLNDLLQLRFKKAGEAFSRFFINSVLGVGGLFDVAGKDGLKHHKNGFGSTLARYGVGPGPYLFLPLVGPTNVRDLLGGQADAAVLPLAVGSPFNRLDYNIGRAVITGLDQRLELDAGYRALIEGAADPYATFRSVFLQNRAAEVRMLKNENEQTTPDALDMPLDDPEPDPAEGAEPSSEPAAPAPDAPGADATVRPDLMGACYF